MTKTEQKSYRLSPITVERIEELGRHWGPISIVSGANVIDECVKRVYQAEIKKEERRK